MAVVTTYAFENLVAEFDINTTIAGDQTNAALTRLTNGQVAYFFQDDEAVAPNQDVLARYMTTNGANGVSEFLVQIGAGDQEISPQAVALSTGNVVVVYQDSDAFGDAGGTSIAYRMFNSAGAAVSINGTTFPQLVEDESDNQTAPAIAALTGGGFVIVLIDQSVGSDNTNAVSAYRFGNDGVQIGGQIVVANATNGDPLRSPVVAGLFDGGFVVVWSEDVAAGTGTIDYDIFAQRYNANGTLNGARITISSETDNQRNPTVTADPDGGFVVAWEDEETGSAVNGNIDFRSVSATGVVGAQGSITATNRQEDASIAFMTNDIFTITYTTNEAGNQDIKAQAFLGTTNLTTYDLETPGANQNQSAAIGLGFGEMITAWTEFGSSADGDGSGVQSQRDRLVRTSTGDGANDTISGDDLRDVMSGGAGSDYLFGAGNDDVLVGGLGADQIGGGDGSDYLLGGDDGDAMSGSIGNDSISGDGGSDYMLGEAGNDAMAGGAGGDVIDGGADNDILWGHDPSGAGDLADLINGNDGNDAIIGHDGADQLYGGSGQDTILGGNGGDVLYGEAGNDDLYGLAEGDAFVYNAINFGADNIWDFTPGSDKIFMTTAVFANFAEVQASAVAGAGFVVITDAGGLGQIALQGFGLAALNAGDWVFF